MPPLSFRSAGRHTFLTTQNGNFGSKANEKGRKRSISTYDMKIQKHQRKLSKKSTSSKTEAGWLTSVCCSDPAAGGPAPGWGKRISCPASDPPTQAAHPTPTGQMLLYSSSLQSLAPRPAGKSRTDGAPIEAQISFTLLCLHVKASFDDLIQRNQLKPEGF